MTRRQTLRLLGTGFGTVGLAGSMQALAGATTRGPPLRASGEARHLPVFERRVVSTSSSFDPKPALTKMDGQPMPGPKVKTDRASGGA